MVHPFAARHDVVVECATGSGGPSGGDALDYRVSQMPVHGTLKGFGKDLVYTPHPDFVGVDAFSFVVSDGTNPSAPATVQIAVQ